MIEQVNVRLIGEGDTAVEALEDALDEFRDTHPRKRIDTIDMENSGNNDTQWNVTIETSSEVSR